MRDHKFLQLAIELSKEALENNKGGPFGCVSVKDGKIIGKGCNAVTSMNDPTAHAEIVAIREACQNLNSFQLNGCEVYSSCEPCPMCLGAIYWARPDAVYFANTRSDAAEAGFDDAFIYDEINILPRDRKIKMVHAPDKEALRVFKSWTEKENKVKY
ncbi:MAG: nucleoside deaminase [Bacteroidia bacterium]